MINLFWSIPHAIAWPELVFIFKCTPTLYLQVAIIWLSSSPASLPYLTCALNLISNPFSTCNCHLTCPFYSLEGIISWGDHYHPLFPALVAICDFYSGNHSYIELQVTNLAFKNVQKSAQVQKSQALQAVQLVLVKATIREMVHV